MLPPIAPLLNPKHILRERMKAERRNAARARPDAGVHAARNFMAAIPVPESAVISVYYPMRDELDTEPLVAALIEGKHRIALPVVAKKNAPLIFRLYAPGDALIDGSYGELIPDGAAPEATPDIVVAPLLAFARDGGRLGYGGGYYDRTLAALRAKKPVVAVGLAFECQRLAEIPEAPGDQRLDWIVTEAAAYEAVRD